MRIEKKHNERGQIFVIVALMMAAILAILALTIDGGLAYFQRRIAQNAADSAALAGARAMCATSGGNPYTEARDYAARNGIQDPDTNVAVFASQVGVVRSVVVTVTLTSDTFFAGMIGIDETEVGAVAEAACYPPCSAGVLPIAWSCTPPDAGEGSVSGTCNVLPQDGDGCTYGADDPNPMYIIADSDSIEENIICQDPDKEPDPNLFTVNCDLDENGDNEIEILSGANRSWLNLDGGSSGSNEMVDWIRGQNVPEVREHTWFNGSTGVRNSVYQAVEDYRLNQNVFIPVFDLFDPGLKNSEKPEPFHEGKDVFIDGGAGDYFHVVTYGTFHVTCVSTGSNDPCPVKNDLVNTGALKNNTMTIEGCFKQALVEGNGMANECNIDAGAYVLKLVR